jgi:hypothetical protein
MPGTALSAQGNVVVPDRIIGSFTVANAEIINNGDPIGINTSGYIVNASKTAGATVKPVGFAVMFDDLSGGTQSFVTGNVTAFPNSPVQIGVARHVKITNVNSTLVPGLVAGKPVYLAAVTASPTVSAYTCNPTATNGDLLLQVGFVMPNGVDLWLEAPTMAGFLFQTSGSSTLTFS